MTNKRSPSRTGGLPSFLSHPLSFLTVAAAAAALNRSVARYPEAYDELIIQGEGILHGIETQFISYRMPMGGICMALCHVHAPPWLQALFPAVAAACLLALAFELGCLLGLSRRSGALAILLVAIMAPLRGLVVSEELLYSATLLLAAIALAWRSIHPTPWRGVLLGLCTGVSLLLRSPLAFFPPLLLAWEALESRFSREDQPAWDWKGGLLAAGVAWLFLLPWACMNWTLTRSFVPFESHRLDCNLITGALGLVSTIPRDARALAGISAGQGIARWAIAQVLHHPLRYVEAVGERFAYGASLHPFLYALTALSLWLCRTRRSHRHVALLAGYYLVLHCLFSVEPRYFDMLLPVLAALAAAPIGRLDFVALTGPPRPALAATWFILGGLLAVAAVTEILVVSYLHRLKQGTPRVEAQLAAYSRDPWLHYIHGRNLLFSGRPSEAEPFLSEAVSLLPDQALFVLVHTLALSAQGKEDDAGLRRLATLMEDPSDIFSVRILSLLAHRKLTEARDAYEEVVSRRHGRPMLLRVKVDFDRRVQARLNMVDDYLPVRLAEFLPAYPAKGRLLLLDELKHLGINAASLSLLRDTARLAVESGDRATAMSALRRFVDATEEARGPGLRMDPAFLAAELDCTEAALKALGHREIESFGPDNRLQAALVRRDAGDRLRALTAMDRLVSEQPSNALYRGDRGELKAELGRLDEAADDLASALRLNPHYAAARVTLAGVRLSQGRKREALSIYEDGLADAPAWPGPEDKTLLDIMRTEKERLARELGPK